MRLLQVFGNDKFALTKDLLGEIPPYAILSHTWGADDEEVTYRDLTLGPGLATSRYNKLRFCAQQASRDGLQYFWVDTCCINREDFTELSTAINSMFRWYRDAVKCYVYLSDLSTSDGQTDFSWEPAFRTCRWFSRGWTLQELIAPSSVEFFCSNGNRLGDKRSLEREIQEITGISVQALRGASLSDFGIDERMLWAEHRQTSREEDKAYSLLGIFDVSMPLIYGERAEKAMFRLQKEIYGEKPLSRLLYAAEAPFNYYQRQHEPTCLPDTRVVLLQRVYGWVDSGDTQCIFWLKGQAGTGKSTIARTVARNYYDKNQLGASFFFSRGGGNISHAGRFVTSIAFQLADSIPALYQHICNAIVECNDISSRSLYDQWDRLVLRPLLKLENGYYKRSFVIVVDALDECDGDEDIRTIIDILARTQLLEKVRLRVLITSRPEIPIRLEFYHISSAIYRVFALDNISPNTVDHDIALFLEYNLGVIKKEYSLNSAWLDKRTIETLVSRSNGLFIWAATACRFIREGKRRFAAKRLESILGAGTSTLTAPDKFLNEIYTTVLKQSISLDFEGEEREEAYRMLRLVVGSIVTFISPLSLSSLSRLLSITEEDVNFTVEELHSILIVPDSSNDIICVHHPSFRDFLLDRDRCTDPNFWVNRGQAHETIAERCIRLMSVTLTQDIYNLKAPGVLVTEVASIAGQKKLSDEVQYACLYWVDHIQKSGVQVHDGDQVHCFLREHLLHWLEALCLMEKIPEGVHAITVLESITSPSKCPQLSEFVYDIKRFVLFNRPLLEQAPLQIYISALIFVPTSSIVRNTFQHCIPQWTQGLPAVESNWNALLQTLEGHSESTLGVAFSPNGEKLASSSEDNTVKFWDSKSGALLQTLEGHSDIVNDVTFSPDGKLLASTSDDKTIKLWNASSGSLVRTLEGHTGWVTRVAFFQEGRLVSGSRDGTIRIWDIYSGSVLQTIQGHSALVSAVPLSPDSKQLATSSEDESVKLWDIATGALICTLDGHLSAVCGLSFSPDGKLLASASGDDTVILWDVNGRRLSQILKGHTTWVNDVIFSPDGKSVASSSDDGSMKLWESSSGALLQSFRGHSGWVISAVFSPDGKQLATASNDGTIKIWDASLRGQLQTPKDHSAYVNAVTFSPDGAQLASASADKTVKIWDTQSRTLLQTLEGHSAWVTAVAFSSNGETLASASNDKTIKIWDARLGTLLHTLEGHSSWVDDVTFSPDGSCVASVSDDKTIKLWDAVSGSLRQTIESNTNFVSAVAFSSDGKHIAWASGDDMVIILWDVDSSSLLKTLSVDAYVTSLSFSKDGSFLQTDSGRFYLDNSSSSQAQLGMQKSIFISERWVYRGFERILWLPPEYRPSAVVVHENTVGLGYPSGQITFMKFAF